MRYLGIDYGARRIGLARSDEAGRMAFPLRTIEYRAREDAIAEIRKICADGISAIVIGLPIGLDGQETDEAREVRQFATDSEKEIALPLYFENEILTSRIAYQAGMRGRNIDAAAAAIILQSYLDNHAS